MFNNQTTSPSSTYACHKWVITLIKSQNSMALADSHHAVWKWQKYSAYDDVRIHFFFTSCSMRWIQQTGSSPTKGDSDQDETKKEKWNRAGQRHVITSPQISWQHISPRCLLCTLSSALSDSAMTCTCILMLVSPICQSAPSHGRKQCEYFRNVQGYRSCQSCNAKLL